MNAMIISISYFVVVGIGVFSLTFFGLYRYLINRYFNRYAYRCPSCDRIHTILCSNCQKDKMQKTLLGMRCQSCRHSIFFLDCECGCRIDASNFVHLEEIIVGKSPLKQLMAKAWPFRNEN